MVRSTTEDDNLNEIERTNGKNDKQIDVSVKPIVKVVTDEADAVKKTAVQQKPLKQSHQQFNITLLLKDTKALFVRTSRGHRVETNKALFECLHFFETIYENEQITLAEVNGFQNLNWQIEEADLNFAENILSLGLFGNRKSTMKLIRHENSLSDERSWLFDIMTGNITRLMEVQAEKQSLNDFYLTVYQLATQNAPTKYLEVYCEQLLRLGDYHKAALYCIAAYDLNKAIDIYLKHHQYQYALCLAQLRFNKNDEIFHKIIQDYAVYTKTNGDFETSVLLYLRLADFSNALNALNRRSVANEEQRQLIGNLIKKFSTVDSRILC